MANDRPYFDPRTGEQITADVFMQRYTAAAFIHVEHPPERAVAADMPGLKRYGATCPGCGVGVTNEGDVCAFCAEKPQYEAARRAMFNLG